MFKKIAITTMALTIFALTSVPASAQIACKKANVPGTYTLVETIQMTAPPRAPEFHKAVTQLTLHADGNVTSFWTGGPNNMINSGSVSDRVGAWVCRADGKLVVTTIWATYGAIPPFWFADDQPAYDITLASHYRTTQLFTINTADTMTLTHSRSRFYGTDQDPSDAAGGILLTLRTPNAPFKRVIASDADLGP